MGKSHFVKTGKRVSEACYCARNKSINIYVIYLSGAVPALPVILIFKRFGTQEV